MTADLTKGKPYKLIIKFLIPIFLSGFFQQVYNMVDIIIIGRVMNEFAFAGVGATGSIFFLYNGFIIGITSGCAVVTSQWFGANDEDKVKRSVSASIIINVCVTVILTVLGALLLHPLLKVIQTPSDIYEYAYDYTFCVILATFSMMLYNFSASTVRALGDSKTPLVFLVISAIINIGLNLLFMAVLKMGVIGAALGTAVSQGLAGIACIIYMFSRYKILRINKNHFKFGFKWIWEHLTVGVPMALQYAVTGIGCIILQFAVNTLGTVAVMAFTAANKIENVVITLISSLGTAMATYCGQNYGAGEYNRIRYGVNSAFIIGLVSTAIIMAFVYALGPLIARLFVESPSVEVMQKTKKCLFIRTAFYLFLMMIFMYRCSLQGIGYSYVTVIGGVIELVMRIIAAFVFVRFWGFYGACFGDPITWLITAVFVFIVYVFAIRRIYKKCDESETAKNVEKI